MHSHPEDCCQLNSKDNIVAPQEDYTEENIINI
jgi:hypothetical protein